MIILKNNPNIENILKRIYQLYKDAKLDPNHFVSVDNLEWSLINENYQYIYKLNNEIKYNNSIKVSDKDRLLTQVTRELRTLKINKLL
jgi:DNA-directed RNA polymerase delta subunit